MYFPSSTPSGAKENPAFAPFGVGAGSCVGKAFVYLQLSLTLARVVWCLDFRAGAAERGNAVINPAFGRECLLQFRKREDVEF